MTARTFGRRGAVGAAAQRRAALVAHEPRSFEPARETDDEEDIAARRAAFVAGERARAAPAVDAALPSPQAESALKSLRAEAQRVPTDRSLRTAYLIWFALGLGGGHRFYLRRPLTGAAQALLFLGCVGAVLAEYYQAFAGLALSWLWMLADGVRLRRLHLWSGKQ